MENRPKIYRAIATLALTILVCMGAVAQGNVKSLEEQIKKIEKEIKAQTELLQKTQKDQKASQSQLKLIQSRISSRREMVNSLRQQIELLQGEIKTRQGTVAEMNRQLDELKKEYAGMVREAYKNQKLNNFALFLFASEDFNDATRRIDFMRRYNAAREGRARQLVEYSDSIQRELEELNLRKMQLDSTSRTHGIELSSLQKDEGQYRASVNTLKQQESRITKEIKAKQQQIEKVQKEIQKIIAEEARKASAVQRTAAEEKVITELSGKFAENRGKMPYPVRGGVITDRYGRHQHPTQRNITTNNNGVNITGEKGAPVYCVFDGEVTSVGILPSSSYMYIMVTHGEYLTVYGNMGTVAVKKGDKVKLNTQLGKLHENAHADDTYLHFSVWKGTAHMDPAGWLNR